MICDPFETPRPEDQEASAPYSDTTWDGCRGKSAGTTSPLPRLLPFRRDQDPGRPAVAIGYEGLRRGTEHRGGL